MKLWVALISLTLATACSGSRQEQREGDSSNHFSEHHWGHHANNADGQVARTSAGGDEGESWYWSILGGILNCLLNSDSSDSSVD